MVISIIIVSWNVRELLNKCLASIFAHAQTLTLPSPWKGEGIFNFEVIVVDNASSDGTVEMLEKNFTHGAPHPNPLPQGEGMVRVIANQKNTGFAYANNQALKQAAGQNILLLNPDTELADNSMEKIVRLFNQHNDWAVVGCKILNFNSCAVFSAAGHAVYKI